MNDSVLALPFDQYQRYRLVADLLRQLRGKGAQLRVLDVGGRTAVLRDFLEDARIDLVDVEASESRGLVLGDGARLPFKDGSFDAVCAFDTLEHVPPPARRAFVAECRRVAKRWVVLAGPYAAPRVVEAERLLQRFLESKLGERHRYLDEHLHHGLPVRGDVEAQLASLGARVTAIGHANLDRWLVMQCLSMYMDYDAALRGIASDFQRFYNASLYASDHAQPVYRHVVVAALGDAPLPRAADVLDPPAAPAGALRVVFDLAAELVKFDRERARWRGEREAFERSVAELRADGEGHDAVIGELREQSRRLGKAIEEERRDCERERRESQAAIAALRADLEGHKAALAEARREVADLHRAHAHTEAEYETLEREAQALREVRDTLERDLSGHKAALAATSSELGSIRTAYDATRTDLEGHRAALAAAQADLEGHRAALAALQANLEGHRAELAQLRIELADERRRRAEVEAALSRSDAELRQTLSLASGLEQSLAQREIVYDQLRAELRSRWRNLLRVFRPAR